ncbi:hypothetical protein E4U52_005629 [Claviceps spartinae]|nr:hypothetical protein E4U52_005629 [Claviceps spartinae]
MVRLVVPTGVCRGRTALYSVCRLQSSGCPKSQYPKSNSARSTVRPVPQRARGPAVSDSASAHSAGGASVHAPSGRYQLSFSVYSVDILPQVSDMLAGGTNHIG